MSETLYYAHAVETRHGLRYMHASPSRRFVELHYMTHPIVGVRVRERQPDDPPAQYWGWSPSDKPGTYNFIWPSEVQVELCFTYGTAPEVARGRGRKVELVITPVA